MTLHSSELAEDAKAIPSVARILDSADRDRTVVARAPLPEADLPEWSYRLQAIHVPDLLIR